MLFFIAIFLPMQQDTKRQIVRYLLENMGAVTTTVLSNTLKRPVKQIEEALVQLDKEAPDLLDIKEIREHGMPVMCVRIAHYADEAARIFLESR